MHSPFRTATPLTLALALAAALACEKAPTETRAPTAPTEMSASSSEVDGLEQQDASTMAIPLPVNQNVATLAPNPAFRINQTGTGPNGIFQITRTTSTQTALQGLTNGRGRAGFFQITSPANPGPALQAQTNGSGFAVQGLAGSGGAGSFQITNSANTKDALVAQTSGRGRAGLFQVSNTNNAQHALQVIHNGTGLASAIYSVHSGRGFAGVFDITGMEGASAILARSASPEGHAGAFETTNTANTAPAVRIVNRGLNTALEVVSEGHAAISAAIFEGRVQVFGDLDVSGTLTKGGGSFKIDHPLDPEHKYLSHSFVESPDMMDVYNGNVTLDADGRATVEVPDYFEALNKDFRYQLTAIGAPGPNLYIAEGVQQNRFRIAGGRAYAHVSWQVTGVRHDAYAEEHRIKVEEEKPQAKRELIAYR
jgi:hypothetical protein